MAEALHDFLKLPVGYQDLFDLPDFVDVPGLQVRSVMASP